MKRFFFKNICLCCLCGLLLGAASSSPKLSPVMKEKILEAFEGKMKAKDKLPPSKVAAWAVFAYCYLGKHSGFGQKLCLQEAKEIFDEMVPSLEKLGYKISEREGELQLKSLYHYMHNRFKPSKEEGATEKP